MLNTSGNIGRDKSFVDDLIMELGIVRVRVASVPRFTEIQPTFWRFAFFYFYLFLQFLFIFNLKIIIMSLFPIYFPSCLSSHRYHPSIFFFFFQFHSIPFQLF